MWVSARTWRAHGVNEYYDGEAPDFDCEIGTEPKIPARGHILSKPLSPDLLST